MTGDTRETTVLLSPHVEESRERRKHLLVGMSRAAVGTESPIAAPAYAPIAAFIYTPIRVIRGVNL